MARPLKQGLDYFPLDVNMDQDDKMQYILALHGHMGFTIVILLLMRIYKEGFFYDWTEKEQLLFSKKNNLKFNKLNDVVNDCIKYDFFSKSLFEKYRILTSVGIKTRYFEASKRRKEIKGIKEYLLIEVSNEVIVNNFNEKVNNNQFNVYISAERKGNETKGNERPSSKNLPSFYKELKVDYSKGES